MGVPGEEKENLFGTGAAPTQVMQPGYTLGKSKQ